MVRICVRSKFNRTYVWIEENNKWTGEHKIRTVTKYRSSIISYDNVLELSDLLYFIFSHPRYTVLIY